MVMAILLSDVAWLRSGTGEFRHYRFSGGAIKGPLEEHLANFARSVRETERIVNYGVTFFGSGGFANVEHFAIRAFH